MHDVIGKISMHGVCCALCNFIASRKKYLPIRALRIQVRVFALSLLAKETLRFSKPSKCLIRYDLIPHIYVTALVYWTGISKRDQLISTAVLGTIPVLIDQSFTFRYGDYFDVFIGDILA